MKHINFQQSEIRFISQCSVFFSNLPEVIKCKNNSHMGSVTDFKILMFWVTAVLLSQQMEDGWPKIYRHWTNSGSWIDTGAWQDVYIVLPCKSTNQCADAHIKTLMSKQLSGNTCICTCTCMHMYMYIRVKASCKTYARVQVKQGSK